MMEMMNKFQGSLTIGHTIRKRQESLQNISLRPEVGRLRSRSHATTGWWLLLPLRLTGVHKSCHTIAQQSVSHSPPSCFAFFLAIILDFRAFFAFFFSESTIKHLPFFDGAKCLNFLIILGQNAYDGDAYLWGVTVAESVDPVRVLRERGFFRESARPLLISLT